MTEREIQDAVVEKLKTWNKHSRVIEEIPHDERCVDLVLIQNERTTSIEIKLHSWRQAINQVKKDKTSFEQNYIAMPKPVRGWSKKFLKLLNKNNIGLLEICLDKKFPFKVIVQQKKDFGTKDIRRRYVHHFINLKLKENYFNDSLLNKDYTKE